MPASETSMRWVCVFCGSRTGERPEYAAADEFFEMLTWAQLRIHAKPIALLNTLGFFEPLLAWLDHTVERGFVKPAHRRLLLVADGVNPLLEQLRAYRPPPIPVDKVQPRDR